MKKKGLFPFVVIPASREPDLGRLNALVGL